MLCALEEDALIACCIGAALGPSDQLSLTGVLLLFFFLLLYFIFKKY